MDLRTVQEAIQSVRDYYNEHGIFLKKFGYGQQPALIIIDMAYGWTDAEYATGSARLDEAVEGIQRLLSACRAKAVPIIYTTSPFRAGEEEEPMYRDPESGKTYRRWDAHACEIDARLKPQTEDFIIYKENASAFFGTHLAAYLIERGVDTVIVTGCSTSACVRATATDARAYRFKPIIPRQCVQDRAAAAHEWNLFDIDAKFGDVVDIAEVLDYLDKLSAD
ncbi:MAG: isochorismatase family protein [Candidatus Poribacteria bacterium]|nr:isochorismatase family protein [Candidatus Poribacteria bacterium]